MIPVALCLVALVVLLVAERRGSPSLRAVAKLGASSGFVWAALSWGALQGPVGRRVLLGLTLCWVGDALLLSSGRSRAFQLGIGAFLLGHVAYALAFAQLPLDAAALLVCALALGLAAFGAWRWLRPHLPSGFRLAVLAYVLVISSMVAIAGAAVGGGAPPLLFVGALGFALSDVSVARERFVAAGFVNAAWGLPAYYVSQLAIAWSASGLSPAR